MKKLRMLITNWLFLCRYAWGISRGIFFSEGLNLIFNTLEPFLALLFPKFIIDELTYGKSWDRAVYYIAVFMGALAVLRGLRLCLQAVMNSMVNVSDVKNGMHYAGHFLNIDYANLEDGKVRDLQQEMVGNVHVNTIVGEGMGETLTDLLRLAGYGYLIFSLHPGVLAAVSGVAAIHYFLGKRREKNRYAVQSDLASHSRRFEYLFQAMSHFEFAKEVRLNQAGGWLSSKFLKLLNTYGKLYGSYQKRQLLVKLLEMVTGFVQTILLYGYAAYETAAGHITLGEFTVSAGAVIGFSQAFAGVAGKLSRLEYLSGYAEQYKEYIKLARPSHLEKGVLGLPEEENRSFEEGAFGEERDYIEFRDVSFRYPHTDRDVLSHVSLKIARGEKLSVVGRNGAGKTTFVKLLCRLYEPTEGVILYNGRDISTIRMDDYMNLLSVVFQDFRLFAFSMEENVVLNRPGDRERVMDAVIKSGLQEKLDTLPGGLDTPVSREFEDEGVEFSGGEGQKLVTARAYYKNAPIVILDEPTAALDPLSESQVYSRFGEIMEGKTAVFISHRMASSRFCDRVAVFQSGQIVEYGTHEQLMAREGLYCTMFRKQAEYLIGMRAGARRGV